jgi:hypothetical protein
VFLQLSEPQERSGIRNPKYLSLTEKVVIFLQILRMGSARRDQKIVYVCARHDSLHVYTDSLGRNTEREIGFSKGAERCRNGGILQLIR